MSNVVGKRIRIRRKITRQRQADLADGKWTRSFVSKLESGKATPSLAHLTDIAQTLDTTCSDLIGDHLFLTAAELLIESPQACLTYLNFVPSGETALYIRYLALCVQNASPPTKPVPRRGAMYYLTAQVCISQGAHAAAEECCLSGISFSSITWRIRLLLLLSQIYRKLNNFSELASTKRKLRTEIDSLRKMANDPRLNHPESLTQERLEEHRVASWLPALVDILNSTD